MVGCSILGFLDFYSFIFLKTVFIKKYPKDTNLIFRAFIIRGYDLKAFIRLFHELSTF